MIGIHSKKRNRQHHDMLVTAAVFLLVLAGLLLSFEVTHHGDTLLRRLHHFAWTTPFDRQAAPPAEQQSEPTIPVMRAILTASHAQKGKISQTDGVSGAALPATQAGLALADGRSVLSLLILAPFVDKSLASVSARAPPRHV